MEPLTGLVGELSAQFPSFPAEGLRRHCAEAMQELGGSVPTLAVPEMLTRLVRLRVMAELLEADSELAATLCATASLTALSRTVRAAVLARLDCTGASLVLLDGNQCFHADEDPTAPVWAGQRFPVAECLAWWSMVHNQPAVINDVDCDERVPAQAYRSSHVRSMVTVPVPGPHGAMGAIGGYWPDARQARRADVGWLQRLAQATGAVVADVGLGGAPWAPDFRTRFPARRL